VNECGECGLDFSSVEAFDKHRVGRHEPLERRCLSLEELKERGFAQDARGRWTIPARAARARAAFARQ